MPKIFQKMRYKFSKLVGQYVGQKKMLPAFIITGMPRSGTSYIAKNLSNSKKYLVTHDFHVSLGHKFIREQESKAALLKLNDSLNINGYGDVSGVHRSYLLKLDIPKKIVVIREPFAVLKSHLNMPGNFLEMLSRLRNGSFGREFETIRVYVTEHKIQWFRFEDLVKDELIMKSLANAVGIDDVNEFPQHSEIINRRPKIYDLSDVSAEDLAVFKKQVQPFCAEFGYSCKA